MPIVGHFGQRLNPITEFINQIEYSDIVFDYLINKKHSFYFISIKYLQIHPEYLQLRIDNAVPTHIICLADDTNQQDIRTINVLAMKNNITLILAFSFKEAGQYLQTFSQYVNKNLEKVNNDEAGLNCLKEIKGVNSSDVLTLEAKFGTFQNVMKATAVQLMELPGFGDTKVNRLLKVFDQPFIVPERDIGRR
ncbi:ssDNA endonuclease and repair protein rad10 [Lobulomyces angularis]|nr:ssDNA endonuclease and repair protein rad10 [Lobulomyces angularis]